MILNSSGNIKIININSSFRMKFILVILFFIFVVATTTSSSISKEYYLKNNRYRTIANSNSNNNEELLLDTSTEGSGNNNNGGSDNSGPVTTSTVTVSGYMTGGPSICTTCTSVGQIYSEDYECSTSDGWSQTGFQFHDPLPVTTTNLLIVHKININFTGIFNETGSVIVTLNNGDSVGVFYIDKQSPLSQCNNCQYPFSPVDQLPYLVGIPSYSYGDINSLIFGITGSGIGCIGKVTATLFYGPVGFKVDSVIPNTSSSLGGDTVYVIGSKFYDSSNIQCLFGGLKSTGTFISSTNISCIVPALADTANASDYNVTIQISEDGGSSFSAPYSTFFIYTKPSLPFNPPTNYQKLIWTIVGVSIAVLLIIGVGIYFIIKLRIKNKRLNGSQHKLPIGINDDERSPLLKTDYKTLFEIKPIDISEIVVQNRIGRGSCAEVFTGTWRGIIVAIKKAKLLNEDDEDFLNELAQEATIMSQLRHPNICQFLGTCNNPPEILIVMEYMPLGSLYRILHDPTIQLDWPRMKSMALDIAKGMNYLHCCDPIVIHRDLKSHNLLVDEHFRVKISDFGLSTRFKKHLDKKTAMTPVGTPCWTAPEVLRNDTYTEKADVFSFAIVLWEIVTREDPYQGMPTFQIVISVGQHKLRPIIPPHVSAPFTRLITECWSEDPQQRPSFQEIVKKIASL